jgi:AAHS family 4-hydroxybenzoate transporter-like MFS transporter
MTGNMDRPVIDVTRLVDDQRIGAFTIRLVCLSFLVMVVDGYDLLAAAYAGPGLVASWHIAPSALGRIFSASPLGMMVGAPLLGWVGDRLGRRRTVILGTILFGLFSLACTQASSVNEMMILRFCTGIGLGGMLPNITALNAEFAPRRVRATLIVTMFMGVTAGSAMPAVVVALLPETDWQTLFLVGGLVPLGMAVVLAAALPESIKFLSLQHGPRARARLERLVRTLRPDLTLAPDTRFITHEASSRTGTGVVELFHDGLQWITPLLWAMFVLNLAANYFLYSWMPTLFRAGGFTASQASLVTACYYIGGVLGGFTVSRLIDRFGLVAVVGFFALGCPAVASIGIPGLSPIMVAVCVFFGGFAVFGTQHGLNATSGLIYPTRIRANGAGWAFGIGRLGGIGGPLVGAWLISMQLPMSSLFLAPAVPLAVGGMICFVVMKLCHVRFRGHVLADVAAEQDPVEQNTMEPPDAARVIAARR